MKSPLPNDESLWYLSDLRAFVTTDDGNREAPLGPWLVSLKDGRLDDLVSAATECLEDMGQRSRDIFADLLGCVIFLLGIETSSATVTCSLKDIRRYLFAFGACGAMEQMRRAGLLRIASPMKLTGEYLPRIELLRAGGLY
jgi:hypothetical protein